MADRVKGIVVEIGGDTVGLSKALSGVNKEIGNTQRELKDVERLLKLDPTNTELLRQKQELLAKSVEQTSGKLEQLKNAEKQVQQQMKEGKVSEEQYNRLQREIIATEQQLSRAEKAAQEFDDEVRQGNADKEMRQTEKAVDGVADALDDAKDSASSFGDYLKRVLLWREPKAFFLLCGMRRKRPRSTTALWPAWKCPARKRATQQRRLPRVTALSTGFWGMSKQPPLPPPTFKRWDYPSRT